MAIKIISKIVDYEVAKPDAQPQPPKELQSAAQLEEMHEKLKRPEHLEGSTYKIKTPHSEHALYVTINDVVLNHGSDHETRRPFEIFINSKNMDHFQWVVAITRIMSAVFRKGGDVTFLVEELKAVFDPRGGYFKAGGVYMPSIVAEIGAVIEDHMKTIGLIVDPELDEHQRALIAEKRAAFEAQSKKNAEVNAAASAVTGEEAKSEAGGFPPGATLCHKCNTQAMVVMDGCQTCLNCGYSKCG